MVMKTETAALVMILALITTLWAEDPLLAQGPSCYVTPGMEKTFVSVRELDPDGNPLEEIGRGWVNSGEQVAITSRTGRIVINYQQASSDKGFQTDPQDCSGGTVISVP